MRVTNNSMSRNYLRNLNRNLDLYNKSALRIESGRKFEKMSENVSDGTRALSIRTQSYKNEQYQENATKAYESLSVAEKNMMSIEDVLNSVHDQTIKALNGTNESASDIFSFDFGELKEQVIQFANCKYNDMYILGGSNNESVPFEVKDGELYYNGININSITKIDGNFRYPKVDENGDPVLDDEGNQVMAKVPYSESLYMDIGIGISVKNGMVDPRSALDMSVSGLDALGYGRSDITYQDIDGVEHTINVPNNACELLDEMSKALDEKDFDRLSALNDHLKKTINNLVIEIADVGVRTNYIENHIGRLETEEDYLAEIQTNLEYIKDTDELNTNKMLEFQWLLTLQYGGKVIPQSLMDYVQ